MRSCFNAYLQPRSGRRVIPIHLQLENLMSDPIRTFRHFRDVPEELDDTHRANKLAMRWTGASERTVKYWFSGERGPSGDHLVALARHSDAVLYVVLALAGRHSVEDTDD